MDAAPVVEKTTDVERFPRKARVCGSSTHTNIDMNMSSAVSRTFFQGAMPSVRSFRAKMVQLRIRGRVRVTPC